MLIETNDILSRKNEIKGYIATANLEKAVKRFMDFYQDFVNDNNTEAVLLSRQYYAILQNERLGRITAEEAMQAKFYIARRVLKLIKTY